MRSSRPFRARRNRLELARQRLCVDALVQRGFINVDPWLRPSDGVATKGARPGRRDGRPERPQFRQSIHRSSGPGRVGSAAGQMLRQNRCRGPPCRTAPVPPRLESSRCGCGFQSASSANLALSFETCAGLGRLESGRKIDRSFQNRCERCSGPGLRLASPWPPDVALSSGSDAARSASDASRSSKRIDRVGEIGDQAAVRRQSPHTVRRMAHPIRRVMETVLPIAWRRRRGFSLPRR